MTLDWSKYPNFTEAEFACRCGCGAADMDPDFMDRLQAIRTAFGKPMVISSGFRCEEYNSRIGSKYPEHVMGMAADIPCVNPEAAELDELRVFHGMPRFGISQRKGRPRFVHIGGSLDLPKAIWGY